MLEGYRIVPAHHVANALDGEGARLWGGRWNSKGVPMIYASSHLSLAALEVRVHIDKTRMLRRYQSMVFHFDEALKETFPIRDLPKDWQQEPPPPSIQQIGNRWIKSGRSAVLAVPSAIVPREQNYLVNPKHPDFAKIKFDKPADFNFDSRLFR